jgi:hypothetical protein
MEAELLQNLRTLADAYATATGTKLVTVAQRALGDWRFFDRLEESERASFTIRKYDAAVAWFADRWPSDVEWPQTVARSPAKDAAA